MIKIINFDKTTFKLLETVQDHFKQNDLEQLHKDVIHTLYSKSQDQSSTIHKKFYEIYEKEEFLKEYDKLIKDFIRPLYTEQIVYQKKPTFRIHMPGNVAVGEFHKDKDYSHSSNELNYWLPFTKAFDTNTVWIESEENKKDFKPYELEYGQILVFQGAILEHGNKPNQTDVSRVSIDFRVMPFSLYDEKEQLAKKSTHLSIPMTIDNYYKLI